MPKFRPNLYGLEQRSTPTGQEDRVAKKLGGRRQPGSGASPYAKGDVKQPSGVEFSPDRFLIECKQTEKKSLRVQGQWLSKITREAMAAGKEPALEFEIQGYEDPQLEKEWIAIPLSVFRRLQEGTDE